MAIIERSKVNMYDFDGMFICICRFNFNYDIFECERMQKLERYYVSSFVVQLFLFFLD